MQISLQTVAARRLGVGVAAAAALATAVPALAQAQGAQDGGQNAQMVEELVVVGSRRQDRSAADSPVPVDVITGDNLRNLGDTDMDSLLAALVPSYNVDVQPISDAGTVVRPASLRALPSDATLILLNGKRRHRGSVISFLGGGISDGAHGPDVAAIPAIALDRVEVLRDGASAQYGSDAIAGVINFVLREDREGGSVEARWGQFYERDGAALTIAGNVGLPIGDNGFVNLSGEFRQADPTSRSVQRADAEGLIESGNNRVRQPAAQIWGSPEVRDDYKLFANMGMDVGANSEFYAFGNYAQRTVEGGFFFRNPHTRGGVFAGPTVDGAATVKVADLSGDGMSGDCPAIPIVDNAPDAAALASVAANPDCFSFIERFPGGFTPQFGGDVQDTSLAFGLRGNLPSGWFYDVSAVFGRNEVAHFMHNTINPQLADRRMEIPTTYYPGTYTQSDRVFDLTVSKPLDVGMNAPLHFAAGLELREETFEREAGDLNSYFVDERLAAQGFGVGSNGFPGLAPRNAGKSSRSSYAAYLDFESNVRDDLLLGTAVRYENYDDFGNTLDGKLTFRYEPVDNLAFRGALSTGYRAPTVGQSNVRNVTTAFAGGMLADEATLPPTHPISVLKGGKPLTPEESVNATLGVVFSIGSADVTVDFYRIAVEDRIARSSIEPLTADDLQSLVDMGVEDARSITSVTFFTNDFDTTSRGLDVVLTMPIDTEGGDTMLTVAANRNDTNVDTAVCDGQLLVREEGANCTDLIDGLRVSQLMSAMPSNRVSASLDHVREDWRFLARFTRYGEFFGAPANAEGWASTYESRWFLDAEAAYDVTDALTVVLGAQNLLDKYPQKTIQAAQDGVGMLYPENSPYGFNGGFYYLRAIWNFN